MLGEIGSFLAASVFGSFFGVIGAEAAKSFFEPRAREKALHQKLVEGCHELVSSIEETSLEYWNGQFDASSKEITAAETKIKSDILRLSTNISDLFVGYREALDDCNKAHQSLRQACTGSNFGDEDPAIEKDRMMMISKEANELTRVIRSSCKKYLKTV